MSEQESFKRKLANLEAAWRNAPHTGRNAEGSARARVWRYEQLQALARTDEVCALLDNSPKLAARWNRMERRHAGLPVGS